MKINSNVIARDASLMALSAFASAWSINRWFMKNILEDDDSDANQQDEKPKEKEPGNIYEFVLNTKIYRKVFRLQQRQQEEAMQKMFAAGLGVDGEQESNEDSEDLENDTLRGYL